MGLRDYRLAFKPFEVEWAYQTWELSEQSHWLHTEVLMQNDIKNWNNDLTEYEKDVVGKILKGFTITETFVGDYWTTFVAKVFPKHEIVAMCNSFGARESIHAISYNHLNDCLDLNDFDAFLTDETTMTKLEVLMQADKDDSDENIARSLALFSACAEGIQLFSSFAILMSFSQANLLKSVVNIMNWSSKDENLHSTAGTKLFREFINENTNIWTDSLKQEIYEGVDLAIRNEFNFIDNVFDGGSLRNLTKEQLKNYMYSRANLKLSELMLEPKYEVNQTLLNEMSWFRTMIQGEGDVDFFDSKSVNYSKANSDWDDDIF